MASADEETGRYLIFFYPEALADTARLAHKAAGITMSASVADAERVATSEEWRERDTVVLPNLGIALSSALPEQMARLDIGMESPIRRIRKEYVFRIASPAVSAEYLRGYQAGVGALVRDLMGRDVADAEAEAEFGILSAASFRDDANFTWGLQATGADQSRFTGKDVRIAILDTGFEMEHPDFADRGVVSRSFIPGVASAQDDNGHGTHCLGTLGGPRTPVGQPRYGVASDAQLFVGKVMKSDGKGNEGHILQGLDWALQNDCRVVSMSLGKPVGRGEAPDTQYEEIGALALRKNCLLIAAAGNESDRPDVILPVEMPANSRTVMAVGAIDRRLGLYRLSNGGVNADGGGIDLVGPGVDVFSSKRLVLTRPYGLDSGTSMAAPHVAGLAALLMEADPAARAEEIWTRLTQGARRLSLPSADVGSGLVQAL